MAAVKANKRPAFPSLLALTSLGPPVDTSSYFDSAFRHPIESPIDQYLQKSRKLNTLITPATFDETLANLILLGHVSATESYFRALIRRIILVDQVAKEKSNKCKVTYGAAVHHKPEMLPEALLEQVSFSSEKNLLESLREFVGIGDIPLEIKTLLPEFEKVCQLRHCIVHRFSLLGSTNAIKLGIELHSKLIEKPVKLDYVKLQTLQQILDLTVRSINNYLFRHLVERSSKNREWTWDYRKDKLRFVPVYEIFSSRLPPATLSARSVYNAVRVSTR